MRLAGPAREPSDCKGDRCHEENKGHGEQETRVRSEEPSEHSSSQQAQDERQRDDEVAGTEHKRKGRGKKSPHLRKESVHHQPPREAPTPDEQNPQRRVP